MSKPRTSSPDAGPINGPQEQARFPRSPDERAETRGEIGATQDAPSVSAELDRRTLLQFMAATLGASGLAGCGDAPSGEPLVSPPRGAPGHLQGEPVIFATTLDHDGTGLGVLATTHGGRPTKIEGNPLHPASLGATDAWAQAEIFSFYNPDRLTGPRERGVERTGADLERFLRSERENLSARNGRGLHILTRPVASPTLARLMSALTETLPEAAWHAYAPIMDDNIRAGAVMAFGRPADVVLDLSRVDVMLCFGGDLFLDAPGHARYAADYAARRRAAKRAEELPRLHVVEPQPSLAGARADQRIPLHPASFEGFARSVLTALDGGNADAAFPETARIAADLAGARGRAVVVVGREQPPIVHALGHAINANLHAPGSTLRYIEPVAVPSEGRIASIVALAEAIRAERVSHLLILGGNPAYDAPADLEFADLIRRVPTSAHLTLAENETSIACRWAAPQRRALESWGDARAFDGVIGLRQPVAAGVAPGWTPEEFIALFLGRSADGRELVRETCREILSGDFETAWRAALETGIASDTASPPLDLTLRSDWDPGPSDELRREGMTALFSPDPSLLDGMHADNAWLQELPRPLTKICWGNAALLSPETGRRLGLASGDVVALTIGGKVLEAPVWLTSGHASDVVTLPLGHGRTRTGRIGREIGFDAYRLRVSASPWSLPGVEIAKTGARREIITTQDHHRIENEGLVRIVAGPNSAAEEGPDPPPVSFYPDYPRGDHAWGMAIDLDLCLGCNACVVACQAENTVPAVGPEETARGREMHWLRIDRYFSADHAARGASFQPVPCMHCEKAPCELVCPVNATVHSSDGLNDMVYARCIGTRTCSNNCPYKVRRFNWFDYARRDYAVSEAASFEVPPRDRGVMEKCTYCVQRIQSARAAAEVEDRPLRDGEPRTACQQVCPTQAIVFGDLNDPESAVSRLKANPRDYALLGDLNTRPRTTYLARIEPPPSAPAPDPDPEEQP